MDKPEPPISHQFVFGFAICCSIFMACIGFLGFLGWSGDSSNQKWAALSCSILGAVGTFVLLKSKNEILYPVVKRADDEIKHKSLNDQNHYWKKEIRKALIGGIGTGAAFWLLSLVLEYFRPPYLWITYTGILTLWRVLRAVRELKSCNKTH